MPVKYGNSTTYNAVEQRLWLHTYILTGYEIVLMNYPSHAVHNFYGSGFQQS